MARTSSVRPAPISPAMPRISPALHREADIVEAARRARTGSRPRAATSSPGRRQRREHPLDAAADHLLDDGAHGHVGALVAGDDAAVAHHHDAVGDLRDLVQPVADIDEGHAFRLELADLLEQQLGLLAAERCGRLVEDQQLGIRASAPWRSRPAAARRRASVRTLRSGETSRPSRFSCAEARCVHRRAVDAAAARQQAADIDVLGDRQVRQQLQLLVDHADAGLDGLGGRGGGIGLPPPGDGAAVGLGSSRR